jgi:hypothetical protein
MLPLLGAEQEYWTMAVPSGAAVIASHFRINDAVYGFFNRGRNVRIIFFDLGPVIEIVQELIDNMAKMRVISAKNEFLQCLITRSV